jgi:hypothetical protein
VSRTLLHSRACSDYIVWHDYVWIAHHGLLFGQRCYAGRHMGREGPMFSLTVSPCMIFWCQLLPRHTFSSSHRGIFMSVPHWDFCASVYKYCNGFDQHVARQQLCKHGPTHNNRGSGVFCRSDPCANRLAG